MTDQGYEYSTTQQGKIELRRKGNTYEFRPAHVGTPSTGLEVAANVERAAAGARWQLVPHHLLDEAKRAFGK